MKNSHHLELILAAASIVLCARPADAGYTIAELRANPDLPVFTSFNSAPESLTPGLSRIPAIPTSVSAPNLAALSAMRAAAAIARANQSTTVADITPATISMVSQVPDLPSTAITETGERFSAALTALQTRSEMTPQQRSAVASVAKLAFQARDVETLTRLALLINFDQDRDLHRLVTQALYIFRHRMGTVESVEADIALGKMSTQAPLTDGSRAWMAARLQERSAESYLRPAQLTLPGIGDLGRPRGVMPPVVEPPAPTQVGSDDGKQLTLPRIK